MTEYEGVFSKPDEDVLLIERNGARIFFPHAQPQGPEPFFLGERQASLQENVAYSLANVILVGIKPFYFEAGIVILVCLPYGRSYLRIACRPASVECEEKDRTRLLHLLLDSLHRKGLIDIEQHVLRRIEFIKGVAKRLNTQRHQSLYVLLVTGTNGNSFVQLCEIHG